MVSNRWIENFVVSQEDLDFLVNTLLETETPMTSRELAEILINQRLEKAREIVARKYVGSLIYKPAEQYQVGQRLVFPQMNFATGTITDVRAGENPDYESFEVIAVDFDEHDSELLKAREFVASFNYPHKLNDNQSENPFLNQEDYTVEDLLEADDGEAIRIIRDALKSQPALKRVAGYWFASELVLDFDIGTLHLAEAVLDMAGGGPLSTEEIVNQIGGVGDAPMKLQVFSLNLALDGDERFAEVGPAGEVLWYLKRMMPDAVVNIPDLLKYTVIDYNEDALSDELYDLETELDDEYTPVEFEGTLRKATSILIYPHRRAGTLPLNAKNRAIFPVARTPRIHVEFVDTSDGTTFHGWVVHEHKYVYGLFDYYTKHRLPIGCFLSVEKGKSAGQILLSYDGYKPQTEWVRILSPNNNQITFENKKRPLGANYDEFAIMGVDELEALDKLSKVYRSRTLVALLKELIVELSRLSPQNAVHAVTLYSAVNMIRRSAPGPIFAALTTNHLDFEEVGNHYWKLRANE